MNRYHELGEAIAQPDVMQDMDNWRALVKEHAQLENIAQAGQRYIDLIAEMDDCQAMLQDDDADIKVMAEQELAELKERKAALEEQLKILMLPKDPDDDRNVVIEVRAGTGGEEAALFGANLYRMYQRFAERHNFKVEPMDQNLTELGGVKEVTFVVAGKGAWAKLKYESGVHRVQRVPETESGGRIHTSAATVAVLPEAEDVEVDIDPNDVRVDVFRSGGHGGQSVNTTDSAVRLTHEPSGIVVTCQDEKSQLKNKEKAMRVLKSRLFEHIRAQQEKEYSENRRSQVGSGDRSERIRTYNFPQGRVTDHRINLTLYKLDAFMDGDLDEMIEALALHEQNERMKGNISQ